MMQSEVRSMMLKICSDFLLFGLFDTIVATSPRVVQICDCCPSPPTLLLRALNMLCVLTERLRGAIANDESWHGPCARVLQPPAPGCHAPLADGQAAHGSAAGELAAALIHGNCGGDGGGAAAAEAAAGGHSGWDAQGCWFQ